MKFSNRFFSKGRILGIYFLMNLPSTNTLWSETSGITNVFCRGHLMSDSNGVCPKQPKTKLPKWDETFVQNRIKCPIRPNLRSMRDCKGVLKSIPFIMLWYLQCIFKTQSRSLVTCFKRPLNAINRWYFWNWCIRSPK